MVKVSPVEWASSSSGLFIFHTLSLGRLTGDSQTHVDRRIHRLPPEKDRVGMLDRVKEDNPGPILSISVIHEVHI